MTFRLVTMLACCAAVALFGCGGGGPSASAQHAAESELRAAMLRYDRLVLTMQADSIAALYTADGEIQNGQRTMARGPDAIRAFLKGFDGKVQIEENATTLDSISIAGDSAKIAGTFRQKAVLLSDRREVAAGGEFEALWVRVPGGGWRIGRMATKSSR